MRRYIFLLYRLYNSDHCFSHCPSPSFPSKFFIDLPAALPGFWMKDTTNSERRPSLAAQEENTMAGFQYLLRSLPLARIGGDPSGIIVVILSCVLLLYIVVKIIVQDNGIIIPG